MRVDSTSSSRTILANRACIACAEHLGSGMCSEVRDTIGSPPVLNCSLKGRDSIVRAGEEMLYVIQCENNGWSAAYSIIVIDPIPGYSEYVACNGGGEYDPSDEKITWNVEKMDRGEGETFTLLIRVKSLVPNRSLLINKVDMTCAEGFCASAVETTVVLSSPLWDLSTVAIPQEVVRGQSVTFRTAVQNIGTMNATNTIVTNPIPDNTLYSRNTGGGIFEVMAHRVVWNLGPVHVNEEREISLTVLVDSNFPTEKEVVNRVCVQSDERADSISISLPLLLPKQFYVSQNYPNPFNQMTTLTVQLPEEASVDVRIYNILGQEIGTLLRGHRQAGTYTIQWDGRSTERRDFTSGVYIYRVVVNDGQWSETRRMMMLK